MTIHTATLPAPTETGPVVVVTGWRDPDRVRWLPTLSSAWTDPTALVRPVVSFAAPPGHPKLGEVLRDLLFALGKSPHVTGGAKTDDGGLDIPAAWLLARQTREIILNDAGQLPRNVTRSLVELAVGVGARIWLIGHHNRTEPLDDLVEDWDAAEWTLEDFDLAWDRPATSPVRTVPTPPGPQYTDLPSTCALTFRADCKRTLTPSRFTRLDAIYRREFHAARNDFARRDTDSKLNHDAVAAHIRRRVRAAPASDVVIVTVRAIEAAALPFGLYIDVDLPALINAAERNPRAGRHDLGDAAALDAYARPAYAAACALAMCEVPPEHILGLTLGDITNNGDAVTTEHGVTHIPAQLRPYLQAQTLTRRFAAATDADRYLLTEAGRPAHPQWITRTIKLAEVECSVRLARPRYDRKALTVFEWMTSHGLAVRSLDDKASRRKQRP